MEATDDMGTPAQSGQVNQGRKTPDSMLRMLCLRSVSSHPL